MDGGTDLGVPAVTEALEERGGPLDVGEEEGDRPGRQARHVAPFSRFGLFGQCRSSAEYPRVSCARSLGHAGA